MRVTRDGAGRLVRPYDLVFETPGRARRCETLLAGSLQEAGRLAPYSQPHGTMLTIRNRAGEAIQLQYTLKP